MKVIFLSENKYFEANKSFNVFTFYISHKENYGFEVFAPIKGVF